MHGWHEAFPAVSPSCCIAVSRCPWRCVNEYQQCSTLSLVTTSYNYCHIIQTTTLFLTWCYCIQSIVSETHMGLQLIANGLEASSGHGAASDGAIMAFFITTIKRSFAKRNLLGKCLHPQTCQIIITLQLPVPNYRIDANTHTRISSHSMSTSARAPTESPHKPTIVYCPTVYIDWEKK